MQTLKQRWATYVKKPLSVRDEILRELNKKQAWFYDALATPQKLSPAEKAVFEKYLGSEIEWPEAKNLPE